MIALKILGINSSGQNGVTHKLLDIVLDAARTLPEKSGWDDVQVTTDVISLRDLHLPAMRTAQRVPAAPPDAIRSLMDRLIAADGLVLASPTRWWGPNAVMQKFLEWMDHVEAPHYQLKGKPLGIITGCEEDGGQAAINNMAAVCLHLGMIIPPHAAFFTNINMANKSHEQWMLHPGIVGDNVVNMCLLLLGRQVVWS